MKVYTDIEQGTKEWHQIRELKFTASHASTIMANGKGLITLCKQMLAEYYSSQAYEEFSEKYKSSHMKRGNEFEDRARMIYEMETGSTVKQVGFIEMSDFIGCSPDGLVDDEGLIEIKCHSDEVFLQLVMDGKIEKKYIDQMQMQMYVSGRKWCDYFAFNPNFQPCYLKKRMFADADKFDLLREGLRTGTKYLMEQKRILDTKLQKGE